MMRSKINNDPSVAGQQFTLDCQRLCRGQKFYSHSGLQFKQSSIISDLKNFIPAASRAEIVDRINGCAMIDQMRSVFSQSPVCAS